MASLNLSVNGPSIKSSYQSVINGRTPASSSATYGQWALFFVQAPLLNAFQDSSAKESILKVQSTGEGELADLVEDFNEGRIQFAFIKVKDPNTGLPKFVLIAWCGGGVPERTKGYFTSHTAAVARVLHGYHVQITARSDSDLTPESIVEKVANASGAKYTAGGSAPLAAPGSPPVAKKPVFTPTTSSSASSFNPLAAARGRRQENVDEDGWGTDAPPITRTQLEKVESAYKPTKVNIADLIKNRDDSRSNGTTARNDGIDGIVRGAYQPVGKVDIAAIRAQAKMAHDDRPITVKGAYEPVGKVDIAAIRARAQRPAEEAEPEAGKQEPFAPRSLAERPVVSDRPERLTVLPKPKVANRFGNASTFIGTKAPTPGGLGFTSPAIPAIAPVGAASRTYADQGGKTPAQLWAEKKAKQTSSVGSAVYHTPVSPVAVQKSGEAEWKSGYAGKTWTPVHTTNFGRGGVETHGTGTTDEQEQETTASSAGGISALRDRFKDAAPMEGGGTASRNVPAVSALVGEEQATPPPPPMATRPSGGFDRLPSQPVVINQKTEEEEAEEKPAIPSRDYEEAREASPIRVAIPVARGAQAEIEAPAERLLPRPVPVPEELPREEELPHEEEAHDARAAATAVAQQSLGHFADSRDETSGQKRAVVQYDYEKAEDNEIDMREGEYITNIEMVDDDWWMGTNSQGESGLFPSNYVELVDDEEAAAPVGYTPAPPPPPPAVEPESELELEPESKPAGASSKTATAQFDYEAAEDNELSFPEGATITDLEFPDEDWWFGHYGGASGLFPANYVQLDP